MKKLIVALFVGLFALSSLPVQSKANTSENVIIGVLGGALGGLIVGEVIGSHRHRHRDRVYVEPAPVYRQCEVFWVKRYDYRYHMWVTEPVQECH